MFQHTIGSKAIRAALPLLCLAAWPPAVHAQTTYTGEAVGASVSALLVKTSVSDTGPLPSSGGSLSTQAASLNLPGLVNLHLLTASTTGNASVTSSQATVSNVSVTVAGIGISATVLTSNASAQACTAGSPTVTGGSTIANLVVNGQSITVTGSPNQTIPLLLGSLIINEQTSAVSNSSSGMSASIVVNALHLKLAGVADVVIAGSQAGVSCGAPPTCVVGIF